MIALLNIIPVVIIALFGWWGYLRWKKQGKQPRALFAPLVMMAISLFFYTTMQPSYLPKGTVARTKPPAFEQTDTTIRDISRKPMPAEERDKRMEQEKHKRLPFLTDDSAK